MPVASATGVGFFHQSKAGGRHKRRRGVSPAGLVEAGGSGPVADATGRSCVGLRPGKSKLLIACPRFPRMKVPLETPGVGGGHRDDPVQFLILDQHLPQRLVGLRRTEQHAVGDDDRRPATGLEQPQEQRQKQQFGLLCLDDLQQVLGTALVIQRASERRIGCYRPRFGRRTWRVGTELALEVAAILTPLIRYSLTRPCNLHLDPASSFLFIVPRQ